MSKRSVLLVEDEPLIRMVLAEVLLDEGYDVSIASNVLQAVGVIGRNPAFDALVTDVDMPGGLNGLDLASMVASHAPTTAIIVTSGRAVTEGIATGWAFIPKPFGVRAVVDQLEASLGRGLHPASKGAASLARAS
ncbi:response regulator [Neorhizobium sp. BT27B]|uniref:response regulator n=1 Tax=Neorhizobium sp. BT27B TaxID=3142625 RepID=UPI003D2BE10D